MTSDNKMNYQNGLIPVVIQEMKTGDVLMLGYMNFEAFEKTLKTGYVYFWSRSNKRLWLKGETSGNKLQVNNIYIDCDKDALLIQVKLLGNNTCHRGVKTCFAEKIL